jgi:hypothetical protein
MEMLFTSANGVSERVSENGSTIMSQRLREDLRLPLTSKHLVFQQPAEAEVAAPSAMVDEGQAAADAAPPRAADAAPPSTTRSRRPEEFAALADYAVCDDFMSEAASEVEVFSTIHVEVEKYAKSLGLCAKQCGDVHSTMPGFKVEFNDFDASKLLICEPPMMASVEGALVQCLRLMQDRFAVSGTPFLISTEYSGERSIICRRGEEVAMEKKDYFKAFRAVTP